MSLEIDWTLLTSAASSSSVSLSDQLISKLNTHLASTSRPSFVGPIAIAAFEFGSVGPSVEIRDIRDVWRAFDDDDNEDDEDPLDDSWSQGRGTREQSFESVYPYQDDSSGEMYRPRHHSSHLVSRGGPGPSGRGYREGMLSPTELDMEFDGEEEEEEFEDVDDNASVYSGMSPRYRVAALGVGMGFGLAGGGGPGGSIDPRLIPPSARHLGGLNGQRYRTGHNRAASLNYPQRRSSLARSHSMISPPLSARPPPPTYHQPHQHRPPEGAAHSRQHPPSSVPLPPSPPARLPGHNPSSSDPDSGGVPSLQLHLHISHRSNLTLTLLTSLQVNYPSSLFMSLPLKLCVTGLTLEMDFVLAYASSSSGNRPKRSSQAHHGGQEKKAGAVDGSKVHMCIVDEEPDSTIPIGQRIIPHVQIESEIGDADVHVLRNVGKVERFIVEALRKTIVDELVFPNFQTVVL